MASVRRLLLAAEYEEELKALGQLVQSHKTSEKTVDLTLLESESPILKVDNEDETRNNSQSLLEDLLFYLIVRKFGASAYSAGGKVILGTDQQILFNWEQRDAQQLTELQSFVDTLQRLLLDSEWDAVAISCLNRVVKRLQDPRARQRFLIFTFQVLKHEMQTDKSSHFYSKFFDEAVRLLLLGVTDLWSAIRQDCAKAAAIIAFQFPSQHHIEQFMDSLLCVAIGSRSVSADKSQVTAWTEREGALLALSAILRSIKVDFSISGSTILDDFKVSQVKDDIKGMLSTRQSVVTYQLGPNERHKLTQLPRCLVQMLKPAIYQCLRHDQLSVRQLAAQCLVEYAKLCETPTRLLIFQEVISKLNRMNRNEKVDETTCSSATDPNESELLDAFEAEGLLDVLARMVPCLPSSFLLKHWKFVFPTLEKYVMHFASSVRQKSSSVVLALATLVLTTIRVGKSVGGSDETSLQLMVHMLLCLSFKRSDSSCFCWQQREGRLLSIEVLVNVLGASLISCQANKLLRWRPESTQFQQKRLTSCNLQDFHWAHERAQWSTWVLYNDCEALEGKNGSASEKLSLVQEISAWVEKNHGHSEIPASSQEFWQQVLSGYIDQTKEAFKSSQFELRRISRQLLPGLMRLVIWTEQLQFLSSTEFETESVNLSWCCTSAKFVLFHLRYLQEFLNASGDSSSCSISQKVANAWTIMWNGIAAIQKHAQNLLIDAETSVAQVEMRLLGFLCYGAKNPSCLVTQFLDAALHSIHAQIPKELQIDSQLGTTGSVDCSLDRQFCIFLVPLLPVYVSVLLYMAERDDLSSSDTVQGEKSGISWSSRWIYLERIILAWISCDDMLRWITMNKSEAESKLLESLRLLVRLLNSCQLFTEMREEINRIIECLSSVFPSQITQMKDAIYTTLLDMYLQLWLYSNSDRKCNERIVTTIITLYNHRQQSLTISAANLKQIESSSTFPVVKVWDDWDDEEETVLQASPVDQVQQPHNAPNQDVLFQEVLQTFNHSQLNMFSEAIQARSDTQEMGSLQMQQQIETCMRL